MLYAQYGYHSKTSQITQSLRIPGQPIGKIFICLLILHDKIELNSHQRLGVFFDNISSPLGLKYCKFIRFLFSSCGHLFQTEFKMWPSPVNSIKLLTNYSSLLEPVRVIFLICLHKYLPTFQTLKTHNYMSPYVATDQLKMIDFFFVSLSKISPEVEMYTNRVGRVGRFIQTKLIKLGL